MSSDLVVTVYLSGPMTGLPEYNYPEFFRCEKILMDLGFRVVNPARTGVREGWTWRDYLIKDLIDLLTSNVDIVATLDGWENSRGASLEVEVAKRLEIPVLPFEEVVKMYSSGNNRTVGIRR